jgi:UDP-2-acetamido-2,6-beta-L-arabino-hexul-4-ose reductase
VANKQIQKIKNMQILVTGANGFIGKNLCWRLRELGIEVLPITKDSSLADLQAAVANCDFVFHLAGVNRPQDPAEFHTGNTVSTELLCSTLTATKKLIPIVYTSSVQATIDNPYGTSKLQAEAAIFDYAKATSSKAFVYRLSNVFGKWCRPNYNSAVATFCHNTTRELPININDPTAPLKLVYIDDVIASFLSLIDNSIAETGFQAIEPVYETTVGEVVTYIQSFKASRDTLITDKVGTGLMRALYSTYVSYLPTAAFSYKVPKYGDPRGVFVEMLKTPDAGQFSFFTAHPGITRGEHYHHTKTEKFLVIKGKAHFGFRQIDTNETYEVITDGEEPEIVETVPGWTHNITNIGDEEMIVMLWANEIFDRQKPDTIAQQVKL